MKIEYSRVLPNWKLILCENSTELFLVNLGRNTTETEYKNRADTVQKWWGLWGLCAFKTGYEQRGK